MLISASPAKSWRVQGVEMGTIPQRDILMEKKKSSSVSQRVTFCFPACSNSFASSPCAV